MKNVEAQASNIVSAIASGFTQDIFMTKLTELETQKFDIETSIIELQSLQDNMVKVDEEQIKILFSKIKDYVQTRNIPECKKFISDYVKEVIVYKDHVEVTFNMVFSVLGKSASFEKKITITRKEILKVLEM